MDAFGKFVKFERAVIESRGQAEAVLHQRFLPCPVAPVHRAHLRQRRVALVHKEQEILGEIVQQRKRRAPRRAVGDDAGIVLDPTAIAQLLHHLDVVVRALADALGFDELVVLFKIFHPLVAFGADALDGGGKLLLCRHIVARGIDRRVVQDAGRGTGDDVDLADAVHLVAEKLDADSPVVRVSREDLHRVAPDAEHIALEGEVVSLVADVDELAQQLVKAARLAGAQGDDHVGVVDRVAQAVDAGDRGDHDHVAPLKEAGGRTVAQALDLIVDGGVLLNEGVGVRDVGLWLVVVVIAHEVLHRVLREKLLELAAQLRGKGLVVRQHQRRAVEARDDVGHRKGLAGAGHAQQDLLVQTVFDPRDQIVYGFRLIARGLEVGNKLECVHGGLPSK